MLQCASLPSALLLGLQPPAGPQKRIIHQQQKMNLLLIGNYFTEGTNNLNVWQELALKLRELGFSDVTLYPGGYAEWVQYGGATHAGDAP